MAVGYPTKVNYATGDILTAANMNDLAGTVNYTQYMKPWNQILNSNMSVWQRGTSIPFTASIIYSADRWQVYRGGYATGATVSRVATGDTTNLPNIRYAMRLQRDSGNTSTQGINLNYSMETADAVAFAGKTVTLSFYARAGANFSAASSTINQVNLYTGTGTDQNVTSGYTGSAVPISSSQAITTTWARYSFTATLATTTTEIGLVVYWAPTGTAGTNDYMDITGIQLEQGSVANTYQPNGLTYQAELAACQRYYYRFTGSGSYYLIASMGNDAEGTTQGTATLPLPVTMRTAPTTTDTGGTWYYANYAGSSVTLTSLAYRNNTSPNLGVLVVQAAAGLLVANKYQLLANNSTASYIGFSAEL